MASSFFITTPIYYVNAKPHLGHAYTTIVADSIARFHKLIGDETWLLTGTDEHGDKIVKSATKAKETPKQFTDRISNEFRLLWPRLSIANDQFIRTTDPAHEAKVQSILQAIYDKGDIYFGEHGGYYCTGCERFYTEKELDNGKCPQHLTAPDYIKERNYFFKMSKYLPWLKEYITEHPDFIRPERYRTEVLAMLQDGVLEDLCISRPKTRLEWGIELPFDKNYVCYVWFDALFSYITQLDDFDGDKFKRLWPGEHLIAKDILKPHGIFWPTMLKSAGLPLYRHLNVHGYWLSKDASKMSKSLGNAVEPLDMIKIYGLDPFRYFLLRDMRFGNDSNFSEDALVGRLNSDLANDLGNLFSRVLSMCAKYFDGKVPSAHAPNADDEALIALAKNSMHNYLQMYGNVNFSGALEELWTLIRACNKYVDSQAPWTLAKEGKSDRLANVIRLLLEMIYKVAHCLWPVMPNTAETMLAQLGHPIEHGQLPTNDLNSLIYKDMLLDEGESLAKESNLFPRVDIKKENPQQSSQVESKKSKDAGGNTTSTTVGFDDFAKLDLRVGTVKNCSKVPNADKLLLLTVDLGEDSPRQIVSGIANYFTPEDLIGTQVCVVANLAPRKIRGIESKGMILTAEDGGKLTLIHPSTPVAPGSKLS